MAIATPEQKNQSGTANRGFGGNSGQQNQSEANKGGKDIKEGAKNAVDQASNMAGDAAQKMGEMASSAEKTVNETVNAVGEYLKKEDLQGMANDLTDLVKRYPLASVAVGFGVGLMLASSMRR